MATEIVIPKLGMTMEKAKVVEWSAQEGDWIEEGQAVLVIETEKVTHEVEALASGFLHILLGPGTEAAVGEAVGLLAESKEELSALQAERPAAERSGGPSEAAASASTKPSPESAGAKPGGGSDRKIKISPAARKIARAHNLDIALIQGTGPGGRIKKEDVEKFLEQGGKPAATEAPVPSEDTWDGEVVDGKRVKASLPLAGIRGAVAEHMHRSLAVSAQLTTMGEFDATELVRLRQSLVEKEAELGVRISYTDIMVYALARALKKNPIINSSIVGDAVKLWEDIHIGVAVSLQWEEYDAGLIVVVVKHADRKSLVEISRAIKDLKTKAREGRIGLDEVTGGTFTLSNVGVFGQGYTFSTPVINQPESAILGIGGILDRPVVVEGEIVVRKIMNFNLTFDHRVINGGPAGKFLNDLGELVSNPYLLLVP
ncbi:MAG: 2-oxo acid dehydrogenase subunit E2 [Deltaproteobacteria bacterium]|nr:MAG: 2-oxo acid dehydrogenase subunit E2 [Deltaproteobacteria bacterium]